MVRTAIINTVLVFFISHRKDGFYCVNSGHSNTLNLIFSSGISDISNISSHSPNLSNSLIGKFCLSFHEMTISPSRKRPCYCLLLSPGFSNQQCIALGINSPYYIPYISLNTSSAILIAPQGIIPGHDFHHLSTYRSAFS